MIQEGKISYKKEAFYEVSVQDGLSVSEGDKVSAPFDAVVVKVLEDRILIKFPSTQLNLISAKGDSAIGPVYYIALAKLKNKRKGTKNLNGSIIITDYLDAELYPRLCALDVAGIITNSIDYSLYKDIVTLAVPIGVIAGFGHLIEDMTLVKWVKSISGKFAWFDGTYNRLVIRDEKT